MQGSRGINGATLPPPFLLLLVSGETVQSLATKFTSLAKNIPNNNEPTKLNFVSTWWVWMMMMMTQVGPVQSADETVLRWCAARSRSTT